MLLFVFLLGFVSYLFDSDNFAKLLFTYETETPMSIFISVLFIALFAQMILEVQSMYTLSLKIEMTTRMGVKKFNHYVAYRLFFVLNFLALLLLLVCLFKRVPFTKALSPFIGTLVFFTGYSFVASRLKENYFVTLGFLVLGRLALFLLL